MLDEMDRAPFSYWRGLLAALSETQSLLPAGSATELLVVVEDPPMPPTPREPREHLRQPRT